MAILVPVFDYISIFVFKKQAYFGGMRDPESRRMLSPFK